MKKFIKVIFFTYVSLVVSSLVLLWTKFFIQESWAELISEISLDILISTFVVGAIILIAALSVSFYEEVLK